MLAAFSITPLGAGESVGDIVAGCVGIVRASGLPNETTAMFTTVEGDWDEIQALVGECIAFAEERAPRVSVVMKVDHRPEAGGGRLSAKLERVETALDRADGAP